MAGLLPFERPRGAPVLLVFMPGDLWKQHALRGIKPPQNGVKFLEDQGAWYTPFIKPNLLGRYDIRQLHGSAGKD